MSERFPADRPPIQVRSPVGSSDGRLSDLAWRVREFLELYGHAGGHINPDGRWTRVENHVRRKVWEGYARRVVLETDRPLGRGWRTYMELSGGAIQYPVPVQNVYLDPYTPDGGGTRTQDALELHAADTPEQVPRLTRERAFQAAERFMSEYAMEYSDREDWMNSLGLTEDGEDGDSSE
jgi:hypothetical protein